jgi:di/tricarboxylate transporter
MKRVKEGERGMTMEMLTVLAMALAAGILFVTEWIAVDLVAMMLVAGLLLSRILTPAEATAGFSNDALLTIGAMFVLSAGLFKSGAVNVVGVLLARMFRYNFWVAMAATMLLVGTLSSFVNNTPVVAIFMPILIGVARDTKISPSKLLMPLSYAAMFGGVCTLIGTSTNLLVSAIAEKSGHGAFSMFELAPAGLLFSAAGLAYMLLAGIRLIPDRRVESDLNKSYGMGDYLSEIILLPDAQSVGKTIAASPLAREVGVVVLDVYRDSRKLESNGDTVLRAGDILRILGDVEKINKLKERQGICFGSERNCRIADFNLPQPLLVEVVIAPNSGFEGKTLHDMRFRRMYHADVLAIRHSGEVRHENLPNIPLRTGDVLLTEVQPHNLDHLKDEKDFLIVSEVPLPIFRRGKIIHAVAIVAGVVLAATAGLLPIMTASLAGALLMVLTGCLSAEESYESIEWRVLFLLAGVLSLSVALEKTGATLAASRLLISVVGHWGPVAVLAAFYVLSSLLTSVMSNNATAVLLAPIAISAAKTLGISAHPLLIAVTFAASADFMTPIGYQTNTMIYGTGHYKFSDFFIVGGPLNLLFMILAPIVIPHFWPFH